MAESLWEGELSPWRQLRQISEDERRLALETAARLMRASVEGGREPGKRIYGKRGRPCPRCGTAIRAWGQGDDNRTVYWCPTCQVGEDPRGSY
jgi:endonuclease-8